MPPGIVTQMGLSPMLAEPDDAVPPGVVTQMGLSPMIAVPDDADGGVVDLVDGHDEHDLTSARRAYDHVLDDEGTPTASIGSKVSTPAELNVDMELPAPPIVAVNVEIPDAFPQGSCDPETIAFNSLMRGIRHDFCYAPVLMNAPLAIR